MLLIVFLTGFPSCAPKILPTDRKVITRVLDFRKFNEEGFFISTTPYIGLYDPTGEIRLTIYPATSVEKGFASELASYTTIFLKNEDITTYDLLKIIVDEAKKLGADGIVNTRIDEEMRDIMKGKVKIGELAYFRLTALAIKRK